MAMRRFPMLSIRPLAFGFESSEAEFAALFESVEGAENFHLGIAEKLLGFGFVQEECHGEVLFQFTQAGAGYWLLRVVF